MLQKILVIQTAFPGDAILATALLESLHYSYPTTKIDILVRKGNETLFIEHPFINTIFIWDKTKNKFSNLLKIVASIRKEKYELVINLQRFASSGLLTIFSGAKETRGFNKNPFSFLFTKKTIHKIGDGRHEVDRNYDLISDLCKESAAPRLYPSVQDFNLTKQLKQNKYICIAPGSVWFTKRFPEFKWIEFVKLYLLKNPAEDIYLLGSKTEKDLCERITIATNNSRVKNIAGEYSFLQSASLIKDAKMNYVNDSAPMHLASSMSARTTAVFCSTVPAFGFGPLSADSRVIEITENLYCRPCGIHGFNLCPEGHFKCAMDIDVKRLIP